MCGVPFHSVDGYLAKLIKKGYRIAICDQMEDPKKAVGIVKREVTKILTPGTVLSDAVLDDEHNQYLAAVSIGDGRAVLGLADVSTGEASWYEASGPYWEDLLMDQIYRMQPAELVLAPDEQLPERFQQELSQKLPQCMVNRFQKDGGIDAFARHFGTEGKAYTEPLVRDTIELMLQYIHINVKSDLAQLNRLTEITTDRTMVLDATAIRNLELVRNMKDGTKKGTLLDILDYTATAMGARLMRQWIESPLYDAARITSRQQAVGTLVGDSRLRTELGEALKKSQTLSASFPESKWGLPMLGIWPPCAPPFWPYRTLSACLPPIGMGSWQSFPPALTVMKPSLMNCAAALSMTRPLRSGKEG